MQDLHPAIPCLCRRNGSNYQLGVLRGVPGGKGRIAERLRRKNTRLPLWLPSRGAYLENKLQFIHVDDVARLIAHIVERKLNDPRLSIINVAGRGAPLTLRRCVEIAKIEVKRVPTRAICRQTLRLLWHRGYQTFRQKPYLICWDRARLIRPGCEFFWENTTAQ